MFTDSSILITGGTGSFGRAFVKTVLDAHPRTKRLVIYSRDERAKDCKLTLAVR